MFDLIPFERRTSNLFNYLDQMNRAFWGNSESSVVPCSTDIIDQGNQYLLRTDLPGCNKEDIHIDMDGDRMTISAQHKEETQTDDNTYIRRERRYGSMSRSFDVSGIDTSGIQAKYENGVLELTLPKKEATVAPNRRIEIH